MCNKVCMLLFLAIASWTLPSATLGVECGEIRFLFLLWDGEQPSACAGVLMDAEFVFSSSDEPCMLSEYSTPILASVRHSSIAIFFSLMQLSTSSMKSAKNWRYWGEKCDTTRETFTCCAKSKPRTGRRGIYYSRQFSSSWIVGSGQFKPKEGRVLMNGVATFFLQDTLKWYLWNEI